MDKNYKHMLFTSAEDALEKRLLFLEKEIMALDKDILNKINDAILESCETAEGFVTYILEGGVLLQKVEDYLILNGYSVNIVLNMSDTNSYLMYITYHER